MLSGEESELIIPGFNIVGFYLRSCGVLCHGQKIELLMRGSVAVDEYIEPLWTFFFGANLRR